MQVAREAVGSLRLDIGCIARENYEAVFRFCARRVGYDRAADAAQETFLTAQRALARYRGESSVTTWLFGIAHNECRRLIRKGRLEPPMLDLDSMNEGSESSENALIDRHELQRAMSKLSTEHREVVLLHEFEGLTYEEAAAVLDVPAGTVKSRLHHAFINLRQSLSLGGGEA